MTSAQLREQLLLRPSSELDPYRIPTTLSRVWKDFQKQHPQENAVRLSSHNLLVVCQGEEHLKGLGKDLDELLQQYPGRTVVVVLDDNQPEIVGYLSVFTRNRMLAGELVVLHGPSNGAPLPSMLAPLWQDGLPIVTIWRGCPPYEESWFLNLVEISTRLVVDCGRVRGSNLTELVAPLLPLRKLMRDSYLAPQAFTDFNWGRVYVWRDWLASLFDRPERRKLLPQVDLVELESWTLPGETLPSLNTLYLGSWLIRQLGWKVTEALREIPGGYQARCGNVSLRFYCRSTDEPDMLGRPVRVTLRGNCGAEPFRLSVERDSNNSSTLVLGGTGPCFPPNAAGHGHRLQLARMNNLSLIGHELESDGRDRIYEGVLETLLILTGQE